jgi:hypothetical protein
MMFRPHPSGISRKVVSRLEREITPPRDENPGEMPMGNDEYIGMIDLIRVGRDLRCLDM